MKLKKCENGHFYDEEKYAFCPHCRRGQDASFTISSGIFDGGTTSPTEPLTDNTSPIPDNYTDLTEERNKTAENLTQSFYQMKLGLEPVVGWLVCLEGNEKGRSFELHAGRNFIGRGDNMDIVLASDMSVSRNKHAVIIYEARHKMFLAQAGESRELFYINDEVVLSNTKLNAYDVLLIGNTKLSFIPFCGDKFAWDENEETDKNSAEK